MVLGRNVGQRAAILADPQRTRRATVGCVAFARHRRSAKKVRGFRPYRRLKTLMLENPCAP
jgi:hypothetical protein